MVESLLITVTPILTYAADQLLTNATGFFFERNGRLFLITSRHVVLDEPSQHRPDRMEISLHSDPAITATVTQLSIPLYREGEPLWRGAVDSGGVVDIAAVEIERSMVPDVSLISPFTPTHLVTEFDKIEVGTAVLIVGFPLGFHDTVNRLPVVRQAVVASSFGIRFQGQGFFLTDARMHRGASGAPVVARMTQERSGRGALAWMLLGVHSARMDVSNRDITQDERLDLNCAWYADVLMTLTAEAERSEHAAK